MPVVTAVCISRKKGTAKKNVGRATLVENHGLENDAHAGPWHRQVSLLSQEKIDAFKARGALVAHGCFGENIVVDGIDFASLPVGTRFEVNGCLLELTQIGKECHDKCQIYHSMGECIMPTQGVFARVLKGGQVSTGDEMHVLAAQKAYKAAVITVSDKGHAGQRADAAGPALESLALSRGFNVVWRGIVPDEEEDILREITRLADQGLAELILTTGGTGFSPRDVTPEATLRAVDRLCPGLPEAMRAASMAKTRRAMLSRAAAGIRGRSLIINLPGSPKGAVECLESVIDEVVHGLDILTGRDAECARV